MKGIVKHKLLLTRTLPDNQPVSGESSLLTNTGFPLVLTLRRTTWSSFSELARSTVLAQEVGRVGSGVIK
jgi:hypothetical protein